MRLRLMKLVSRREQRGWERRHRVPARRQAGPEQVECGFDPGVQSGVAVKGPDQQRAENGLAKNIGDLRSRKVVADFAAVMTELNHLAVEGMDEFLQVHHGRTNRSREKIGLEKRADDGGVACGLLRHAHTERTEEVRHGLARAASHLDSGFQLAELHFSEGQEDVVLAREIIEKGAFADVSSLSDVLNSRFGKSPLGEKIESGAEKSLADVGAAALATVGGRE